jgi:hypothetical protein
MKDYMLNIKVYVVTLISVQFNKLTTQYSSLRYGRPKGNCNLNLSEFGISRNIYGNIWGKRKTHSTFVGKGRKESSYTKFMDSVPFGSELHKKLIKLDNQLIFLGYSDDLTCILSNFEFLRLSWKCVKFRNKDLYLKKYHKLLKGQFEIWFFSASKKLKSGHLNFDLGLMKEINLGLGLRDINKSKFLFGDLVLFQALYVLLMLVFNRFSRNSLDSSDLECGDKLVYIKNNFNVVNWFISGNLIFNKDWFMLGVSKIVKDQLLKDLLYKYFKLGLFKSSLDLKDYFMYENKLLSEIILNIYFNAFDEWLEDSLVPRYIERNNASTLSYNSEVMKNSFYFFEIKGAKIIFLRYLSNVIIGIIGSKEVSIEIFNRIEEKVYEMTNGFTKSSNFRLTFNKATFLGYDIKKDGLFGITIVVPIKEIVLKLTKLGFLSKKGFPTRNCKFVNCKLSVILFRYQKIERSLLKRYCFLDNYNRLSNKICYVLKYSCALTICSKMKLKTLRRTFKKYGRHLGVIKDNKLIKF